MASESDPRGIAIEWIHKSTHVYWSPLQYYDRWKPGTEDDSPKAMWFRICQQYSCRQLSNIADKMTALSGVASSFHTRFYSNAQYLAGLWSSDMPEALGWNSLAWEQSSDEYFPKRVAGLPSWSWASTGYGIQCEPCHVPTDQWLQTQLLHADMRNTNTNPFGDVDGGRLRLKGKFKNLKLRLSTKKHYEHKAESCNHHHTGEGGKLTGFVYLDDPDQALRMFMTPTKEFSSPAMMLCRTDHKDLKILLLERAGTSNPDEFRRIGLYLRWHNAGVDVTFEQGWHDTEITLV